ncbi:unnamed protein product [Ostreobium quekettii]|uniref:Uncharacterized protein n=1 Tax=Ostreobium quekettii TaxID=121088 RepID=A0A8S1IS38_9CHLO|nr:unnamed protein product [Ostreobium quekettii]
MGDGIPPASAFKLRGDAKLQYVRELFDRIADRYDFVNVIISMGHSTLWRWRALWFAGDMLPVGARVLDVGCGSGRYGAEATWPAHTFAVACPLLPLRTRHAKVLGPPF